MRTEPEHCDACGARYARGTFPKSCSECGRPRWLNPLPVAVALVPVGRGLLVVKRNIEPRFGEWALPGGFVETGESWREATTRELQEETGFEIPPEAIEPFAVESANDHLLVFGLTSPLPISKIDTFRPNDETSAIRVLEHPEELAFGFHTSVTRRFFQSRGGTMTTFYHYPNCSTCRKAAKWLDAHDVSVEKVHLVEETPSKAELKQLWRASGLDLKRFFNTSGGSYRALNLKDKYAELTDDERLELLANDGMLIKRPILEVGETVLVGFKQEQYDEALA